MHEQVEYAVNEFLMRVKKQLLLYRRQLVSSKLAHVYPSTLLQLAIGAIIMAPHVYIVMFVSGVVRTKGLYNA